MDGNPVLAGAKPFPWQPQEAVSYEVAIEAITEAVACYTVLIQQARLAGDTDRARELDEAQTRCIQERNRLRSTDQTDVARVQRQYPQLTQRLREQMR